jgi:hypothetical protein
MIDPIKILRAEGGLVLVGALCLYGQAGGSWLWLALLLLLPDVTMAGYHWGPRVGAFVYNLGHSYILPGLLVLGFMAGGAIPPVLYIWFAHIGLDRLLGYGLKQTAGFRHTHLGLIGKD